MFIRVRVGVRTDYCTSWAREWIGGLAPGAAFFAAAAAAAAAPQRKIKSCCGTRGPSNGLNLAQLATQK